MEKTDSNRCVFCNFDLVRSRLIEETKNTFSIFSNPCLVKGHVLVIPKRHVEKLSELSKEERDELIEQAVRLQEILLKKFKGCDIRQNYRPFQTESKLKVNHLHVHLQPRELFDELYEKCQIYEGEIFKELSQKDMNKLMKEVFGNEPQPIL
jgi:histidine triad (HIT) family protein